MRPAPAQRPSVARAAVRLTALAPLFAGAALWIGLAPASGRQSGPSSSFAHAAANARPDGAGGPLARAARTVYLRELGRLRYVSGNESTLDERGSAAGTFNGALVARLTISSEHVNATFTIYPRGGSVTGKATARFIVRGHTGYYGGTLKIVRGTGAYRHAQGTSIGISGTIDRYSFALIVKANGWIRY